MPSLPLSNHKKIKSVSFSQSGQINGHTKFLTLPKTKEILLNWLMIGTYVLMRVLLCKIQCPSFICFCKPSPHIYASGSLKLEDTPPPPPPPPQVSSVVDDGDDDDQYVDAQVEEVVDHVDGLLNEAREEEGKEEDCALEEGQSNGEILKSSLKKETLDSEDGERREKKKVQWVDLMGKELAEIREFESSEEEEIRYDGDRSCVCVIL